MKRIVLFCFSIFVTCQAFTQATNYKVVSNSQTQTVIDIQIDKVKQIPITTQNGSEVKIIVNKGTQLLFKGCPDIPKLAFSILIPNQKNSTITILETAYEDFQNIAIAPSKGTLSRNIDPASIPFIYGDTYQKDEFFPAQAASLNKPYILRDFRGQTVMISPVQYNPITKTMRVYSHMKVKVTYEGISTENIISTNEFPKAVVEEFDGIYKNHFINYEKTGLRYSPILQQGSLLIVSPASYLNEMTPFIKWKEMKGFKTYLVNTDTMTGGLSTTSLKALTKSYFHTKQIAYLLIVGDNTNISPITSSSVSGPSDNAYAYINGTDHYPEFIVGRFSGENVDEINTQVARTLQYEKAPNTSGNWMQTQIGIASEQGPGDDNQLDWEHIHNIVDSNKNQYNYLTNIEEYEGTNAQAGTDIAGYPTKIMLKDAINGGASLINYCGHGHADGIGTTDFQSTDIPTLTNVNKLPFMYVVGCSPGEFVNYACFAEKLQRAKTNTTEPYGTISNFMATIAQTWDEPMQAQDEFNAIMRGARPSNLKSRLGAMCMDACMSMNDQYDVAGNPNGILGGSDMTDTWIFFGDPTVSLFTKNNGTLTITNDMHIQQHSTTYSVNCNSDGATIGLFYQGKYLASSIVSGGVANFTFPAITALADTVFITATKQNYSPASSYSEIINWPSTVNDIYTKDGISVYPNPTVDVLNIISTNDKLIENIKIIDALGNIVSSQVVHGNNISISTKQLALGTYRAIITTSKGNFIKSFSKK